jgi:hydrogenase maturation protease
MNILVLGLGNILCRDEGVGVRVIEALQAGYELPAAVEVLDGGTSGMELLDTIAGREVLIVVDAVAAEGAAPGEVLRLADDAVQARFRTRFSPHQQGLAEVLALLRLSDEAPRQLVLVGIVPDSLELGLDLTPAGERGRDAALARLVGEMSRLGLPLPAKAAGATQIEGLEKHFRETGERHMRDLPIYNAALAVEAIDFQPLAGEAGALVGVLLTPWFMNAVVLPAEAPPFDLKRAGQKQAVALPSGQRDFLWGGDEPTGLILTYSLRSPVLDYKTQDEARAAARRALAILLRPEADEQSTSPQAPGATTVDAGRDRSAPDSETVAAGPQRYSRRDLLRPRRR